ncbi:MAG: hypothetical protein U1D66_13145 [Erythrobacter sp.]|nr:hypothetical protein [Erythrobacter sp.]
MASAPRSTIQQTPLLPPGTLDYRHFAGRNRELVAEIVGLRAEWKQALSQLGGLTRRQQHNRVRQLLRSERFGIFHAYRGILKANRIRHATRSSFAEVAERLDPFGPCHERVIPREIVKDGRARTVDTYGPIKRAHQHMVADVIRALHPPRANQFMFHGGIPTALAAVEAACARSLTHAVELDVEGFYRSIPAECLAGLLRPLPRSVVDHVVWDLSHRTFNDDQPVGIMVRRTTPPLNEPMGLSLGSASSPIVGEVVIGQLLAANEIDFGPDIITYADNLLVLGRSEQEAEARAENLTALASSRAFCSLRLREKGRGHFLLPGSSEGGRFSTGVTFAGQFGRRTEGGQFTWEPTPERQIRHWAARRDHCPSLAEIARAKARVAAFHRAYPRWQDREIMEAEERARLSAAHYLRTPTAELLAAAGRDLVFAGLLMHGTDIHLDEMIPDYQEIPRIRRQRLMDECVSLAQRIARRYDTEQAA